MRFIWYACYCSLLNPNDPLVLLFSWNTYTWHWWLMFVDNMNKHGSLTSLVSPEPPATESQSLCQTYKLWWGSHFNKKGMSFIKTPTQYFICTEYVIESIFWKFCFFSKYSEVTTEFNTIEIKKKNVFLKKVSCASMSVHVFVTVSCIHSLADPTSLKLRPIRSDRLFPNT